MGILPYVNKINPLNCVSETLVTNKVLTSSLAMGPKVNLEAERE